MKPVNVAVSRAKAALSQGDSNRIKSALANLAEDQTPEATEFLVTVLGGTNWHARKMAATLLTERGDSVLPYLALQLGNDNLDQAYWICHVLSRLGSGAQLILEGQLNSPDSQRRRYAIHSFAKRTGEKPIELLIQALDDPLWTNRKRAAECLSSRADKDLTAKILRSKMVHGSRNQIYWGVRILPRLMGERALPILEKLLKLPDSDIRYLAVTAMGALRSPAALPWLVQAIEDPAQPVRERATEILASMGAQSSDRLQELARSGSPESRYWSLRALLQLAPEKGIEAAVDLLKNPNLEIRHAVVRAAAHVPSRATMDILFEAFRDTSWTVRKQASNHLAATGERAVPLLEEGVGGADQDVVYWCIATLGKVGTAGLPKLKTMLAHQDADVRGFVIDALSDNPSEGSLDLLVTSLGDKTWPIRRQAATVLTRQGPRAGKFVLEKMYSKNTDERFWCRQIFKDVFGSGAGALITALDGLEEFERRLVVGNLSKLPSHELEGLMQLSAEDIIETFRT